MDVEIGTIRPDEYETLYELVAAQIGEEDVEDVRVSLDGAHARPDDWVIARVDGRLAACAIVVPMAGRVGSIGVPSLAVEVVATDPAHTGQGLQRRIFSEIEVRHPDALLHVIEGIPYFYRRLGYEYAIPHPTQQVVDRPDLPPGWEVREAAGDDVPLLLELQEDVQRNVGVAFAHPEHLWHWVIESSLYRVVVATDGSETAMGRGSSSGDDHWAMEVAAASVEGVRAVAAGVADGNVVRVYHRVGLPELSALGGRAEPSGYAYYARVADPEGLLDLLRPEFEARLAASELSGWSGRVLLSTYGRSFSIEVEGGVMGPIEVGGPVHAPVSAGGSGVPPDLLAHLVLGPLGARGLAERHPDVLLGRQAELMGVLFPPRTADVHTWVAP